MVTRRATFNSVFATVVLTSLLLAAALYRDDPRRLLRAVYVLFLVVAALIGCRYLLQSLVGKIKVATGSGRTENERELEATRRPDLDTKREKARRDAQSSHEAKAEHYELRIGGPRREQKFLQMENKMKFIRGFTGGGVKLGGDKEGSRLVREEGMRWRGSGSLSHVTDSDQSDEEHTDDGKLIRVALRLNERTVYKEFRTTQKIRSLYKWLKELGYSSKNFVLVTPLPRRLLDDLQLTLADSGLTADTILMVDERD